MQSPPAPHPPQVGAASIPLPNYTSQFQGSGRSDPHVIQICFTLAIMGKFGYPPTVSKLFSANVGSQREPIGWSLLTPQTGTPLPGTGATADPFGKYTY